MIYHSGAWNAGRVSAFTVQARAQLYVELLPRINARTIRLLDHPRANNQICALERRTVRGGRDTIDHAPGAHDDLANAIAGLCACTRSKYRYDCTMNWVRGPDPDRGSRSAALPSTC
jgi:hypothetical protein